MNGSALGWLLVGLLWDGWFYDPPQEKLIAYEEAVREYVSDLEKESDNLLYRSKKHNSTELMMRRGIDLSYKIFEQILLSHGIKLDELEGS